MNNRIILTSNKFGLKIIIKSLFLILLLIPACSFSQSTRQTGGLMDSRMASQRAIEGTFVLPLNEMEYKGSPYINEEHEPCDVLKKGIKVGSLYYRYNAYNEEIMVRKKLIDYDTSALMRDGDISILTKEGELIFKEFLNKDKLKCRGYLLRLAKGKYSIFKRQNVKFTEAQKAVTSFDKDILAKFTKFTSYYLQIENNKIIELNLKKKSLLKSISSNDKERLLSWEEFDKKKIKNDEDLKDIFDFLNQ